MTRFLLSIIFLFFSSVAVSQDYAKWKDHLSYNNTSELCIWKEKVVVAGKYGVFIYNSEDNSISKFTKLEGLSGEEITSLNVLKNYDAFAVGYSSGDFSIIYSDGRIVTESDIKNSSVTSTKTINYITEREDENSKIYIATDFGIVEYNMDFEKFGDTFFFGDNGSYINVTGISFLDNLLFASTNNGVYIADSDSPYLVDYNQWAQQKTIPQSEYNSIAKIDNKIVANNSSGETKQYVFSNGSWSLAHKYSNVTRIKSSKDYLVYSRGRTVSVLDSELNFIENISLEDTEYSLSTSAIKQGESTWISSSKTGLVKVSNGEQNIIIPDGPTKNNAFRITTSRNRLYLMYGYHDQNYAPRNGGKLYDKYIDNDWHSVDGETFGNIQGFVNVVIDPRDDDHIYISSWGAGVVEMQGDEFVEYWNNRNSTLQKLDYPNPSYVSIRIGGGVFDEKGNVWFANGWNVDYPFVMRKEDGSWMSFPFISGAEDNGMQGICIDFNSNKWIGSRSNGIFIYNEGESLESTGDDKKLLLSTRENQGNLPSNKVLSIAIDKDNEAWIGTQLGLVVFNNIDDMFESVINKAEPVIINVNGEGQKLLGDQQVNKIVVDGANNKWFATQTGGVYYTSANGQETIHHFTKENSPLFSNTVLDLGVDPETGIVYFLTDRGLVSFIGNATEGGDSFGEIIAYPNPVKPGYDGDIYIKGLTDKTNVKITDISGNVVSEVTSQGGQAVWNGKSLNGGKVASGVYLVFAISKDGESKAVAKILIVN